MEGRYIRNRLYVSPEEQAVIKQKRVVFGGAGIGSIIAECALRFGFERITIVDGDVVEESNLNRQNYCQKDIGRYKAEVLAERLLAINPTADIQWHNEMITQDNVEKIIGNSDYAINALDFSSDIPFVFDEVCKRKGIPVLHPYNFGWAGFLTVVNPSGTSIRELSENPYGFELKMAEYATQYSAFWQNPQIWLENIILKYKAEKEIIAPPQLSVGSWITAGYCVNVLFRLSTGEKILWFPKFYLSSVETPE